MGTLAGGEEVIQKTLLKFHDTKGKDQKSEAFPLRSRRLSLKTREIHNLEALQEQYEKQEETKKAGKK